MTTATKLIVATIMRPTGETGVQTHFNSFLHYLDVRCDSATQLEHRDIADAIKQIFCEQFPIIAKAKGWIE